MSMTWIQILFFSKLNGSKKTETERFKCFFFKKLLDQLLYAPESLNRSCAAPAASAGLGLEEDEQEAQAEEQENTLSEKILEQQSWFIR